MTIPATIKSLNDANVSDCWDEAIQSFGKRHPVAYTDNMDSIDDILRVFPKAKHFTVETINTPTKTTRRFTLFDEKERSIFYCDDLKLKDGKLYVKRPHMLKRGWSFFSLFRFPRINFNVRR